MKNLRWAPVALALLFAAQDASAATATANLRVQANVTTGCIVDGNTLDFGQVPNGNQRPQTNINVTCTNGTNFALGIGDGSNVASGQRRMKQDTGTGFLAYELYKALTGTDRFGDSITSQRVSGTGTGTNPVIVPVFGGLVAGQVTGPGNYIDNAVITVYF